MKRRTPLRVEMMEVRQLLSGLAYSLTTDKSVYQAGDTINFTFTETNTSTQPVNVSVVPTDFTVNEGLDVVFQSNPGSSSETATSVTLQPGRSVTQTASWSGTQRFLKTEINLWGSFAVSNANASSVTTAFQISDPLVNSISTNRTVYRVGQPVKITSYATNTSTHPVTVANIRSLPESFQVTQNGTTIWTGGIEGIVVDPLEPPPAYEVATTTIQPGQAATDTVTWHGVFSSVLNSTTASTVSGSFVASFPGTPQGPTASFQIESPIKYSIAVRPSRYLDQPGYQAGEPVSITFTETNTSDQPVTVVVKRPDCTITNDYQPMVVWQSDPASLVAAGSTKTLQPGQSITRTATWNDIASHGPLASASVFAIFSVTNQNGPSGLSATFGTVDPLKSSLTTNQQSYVPGEPVKITVTETNTSAYRIVLIPSGTFTVTNAKTGATVFSQASVVASQPAKVEPGQSFTRTVSWVPSQTGAFNYSYQDPQAGDVGLNRIEVTSTLPNPPVTPVALDLTTNQSHYRRGQAVGLTLTLTNTSTTAITLTPGQGDGFSVLSGSTVVWHSSQGTSRVEGRSLAPGKSITLHLVWTGKPNQARLKKLTPGAYTVEALLGGYAATTTIQITA